MLVGGGDPFLTRKAPSKSAYPRPADLATLAGKTAAALKADGRTSVRVRYDDSALHRPDRQPHLARDYVRRGRADHRALGRRGDDAGQLRLRVRPRRRRGRRLREKLRAAGITVTGTPRRTTAGEAEDSPGLQPAALADRREGARDQRQRGRRGAGPPRRCGRGLPGVVRRRRQGRDHGAARARRTPRRRGDPRRQRPLARRPDAAGDPARRAGGGRRDGPARAAGRR